MDYALRSDTAIFALGGLGEVGKNMYCIEYEDSLIIIDSGAKFPESDLPGIDYVIPDYSYLVRNQFKVKALFITHGHEDHIGGIPFLLQKIRVPKIYAPRLAASLIRKKLEEHRLKDKTIIEEITEDKVITVKDLSVKFFRVTHSIPDAFGICVDTPNGRVVTTGDFKIDLTPVGPDFNIHKLAKLGEEGIDLLLSDSTNAEVEGYSKSEQNVIKSINEIFRNAPGRLIIATFASNINRIQQIIEAAVLYKRKIVVVGRSMEKTVQMGREAGYIVCPDSYFLTPETIKYARNDEILILCTGSQGEPLAALSRIAQDQHRYLKIMPGDTVVFSSSPIPGNTTSVNKVINLLTRSGAVVITNSILSNIHATGHASQDEQKLLIKIAKPKYFMPVHGEYRMQKLHADIANEVGVPLENIFILSNGDSLLLNNGVVRPGKRIDTDDIYVDGNDSSGLSTAVIRDRRNLGNDGLVAVLVSMDSRNNKLLCSPSIVSRGFMHFKENDELLLQATTLIDNALKELFKDKVTFSDIKNTIRNVIGNFFYQKSRRNPMIIPVLMNKIEHHDTLILSNDFFETIKPVKRGRKRSI
ncbi:TPA: ribonuclease J [bacterium]|nr:ribonuclease J [bacterium]